MGPPVITPLAEALSNEQDARARRRLRDILVGFGAQGREAVQQLMSAPNWEVRRTAAFLLREFGGTEGLKELVPLLTDPEPLVQREAIQGLVLNGTEEASAILLSALGTATGRTRETLVNELIAMREERAAPVFAYLLRRLDRRAQPQVYSAAIEALGTYGGTDAVEALRLALYKREWWAPLRTRRLRGAIAAALGKIGTDPAIEALQMASKTGPRGVRSAARGELARSAG
jgi:HEAT repeat protein